MLSWFAFPNDVGTCYVLFDETPERDLEIFRMSDHDGEVHPHFCERPPGTAQSWVDEGFAAYPWRRL